MIESRAAQVCAAYFFQVLAMEQSQPAEPFLLVVCPTCGARLHPRRELVGKRVRCPDCGVAVRVTANAAEAVHAARSEGTSSEYRLSDDDRPVEQPKTVLVVCGLCGARLNPRADLIGKHVRCPDCFKPVLVTAPRPEVVKKAPPPPGEYRLDAEPPPNPLASIIPIEPKADPLFDDAVPPPPPPSALWFWSGVFNFPWYLETRSRWMTLTILSAFANGAAAYGLSLAAELASASGPLAGYGVGMKVAGTIAVGAILWLLMLAYASGCVVSIVRETAGGNDEVTDWHEAELHEGVWRTLDVIFPLAAAASLGYFTYRGMLGALPADLATAGAWSKFAGTSAALVLFPAMLLSAFEQGAFWAVVSWTGLRMIITCFAGWLLVNAEAAVVTGAWWGLTWIGARWLPLVTAVFGAPLFAAVIMIDARLLGRFMYRAGDALAKADAEDEDAEDDDEDQ